MIDKILGTVLIGSMFGLMTDFVVEGLFLHRGVGPVALGCVVVLGVTLCSLILSSIWE